MTSGFPYNLNLRLRQSIGLRFIIYSSILRLPNSQSRLIPTVARSRSIGTAVLNVIWIHIIHRACPKSPFLSWSWKRSQRSIRWCVPKGYMYGVSNCASIPSPQPPVTSRIVESLEFATFNRNFLCFVVFVRGTSARQRAVFRATLGSTSDIHAHLGVNRTNIEHQSHVPKCLVTTPNT